MNMRVPMSDAEMLAQRQARIGKTVVTAPQQGEPLQDAGRPDPGVARATKPARTPFEDARSTPGDEDADDSLVTPADVGDGATVAELRAQLAAAQGRVGPLQQQLEQFRATAEALQTSNATLSARQQELDAAATARQAAEAAAAFDPLEGMDADVLEQIDPVVLEGMRRSARAAMAKATAGIADARTIITQTLQERDTRTLKAYVNQTTADLNLVALGSDPRFKAFLENDGAADMLMHTFLQVTDLDAARDLAGRMKKMVKRFSDTPGSGVKQNPDPKSDLSAHLSRSGSNTASGASGHSRKALTPEMVKDIQAKARALSRKRNHKDAQALLAQLN